MLDLRSDAAMSLRSTAGSTEAYKTRVIHWSARRLILNDSLAPAGR